MEVFVFVHYHQNKETGEEELLIPEVYASIAAAAERYKKATEAVDIPPFEDIYDFTNRADMLGEGNGEYFLLDSDVRHICIYYKKVKVKE